jgi:hypothetical protein
MDGDASAHKPRTDPHTIVEQAERIVAERAGISVAEASIRISLYTRFHDLQLVDVCHGIIDGTISLLHYGERRRQPPSTDRPV